MTSCIGGAPCAFSLTLFCTLLLSEREWDSLLSQYTDWCHFLQSIKSLYVLPVCHLRDTSVMPDAEAQEKKAAMGQKQVKQLRAKPPLINLSKKHRRLLKHVLVCVVAFAVMLIFVMAAQHESSISKQAYKLAVKTHQEQQKAVRAEMLDSPTVYAEHACL